MNSSGIESGDAPFARTLFEACDRLRGSVESAEYKHLVLGLIFVSYVSEAFERRRAELKETSPPLAGYARVSTVAQAESGIGLAAQRRALADAASAHGLEVGHV